MVASRAAIAIVAQQEARTHCHAEADAAISSGYDGDLSGQIERLH
jgi:hypothetical protein